MILPKKKFYIFRAGQDLPWWLCAWVSIAETPEKTRELSFTNRHGKLKFGVSCTVKITETKAIINPIPSANYRGVLCLKGMSSLLIFGVKGLTLIPSIDPHLGSPIEM